MSDLFEVIPDFDRRPYSHLFHSLEQNDYTVNDLITNDPKEIARKCPLPHADVQKLVTEIIKILHGNVLNAVQHRHELGLLESSSAEHGYQGTKVFVGASNSARPARIIRTLDQAMDNALNGGIRTGHVTEIVGESAVGKTQLVLGLLLSAQLPAPLGLDKSAMYLSTEAPLNTARLYQMLHNHPKYKELASRGCPTLDKVYAHSLPTLEIQEHILQYQVPVAVQNLNIGLLVLDSAAANFRAEHNSRTPAGLADRASELAKLGSRLRKIAVDYNIAVVVTNQVSDRFRDFKNILRSSSPATSSPAIPVTRLPPEALAQRQEMSSLDYQQQFFTGWGDGIPGHPEDLKNPALGLAWANHLSARIVLKLESERFRPRGTQSDNMYQTTKKMRSFAVVFAPWAPPTNSPLWYEIKMQGVVSANQELKSGERVKHGDAYADLLNEEFWVTDDDEEFP